MHAVASACLDAPNAQLGNIEGAHRVHGWPVPLRVANLSVGGGRGGPRLLPIAVLAPIGEPQPYVFDAVSSALAATGRWELESIDALAAAAGWPALPPPASGAFVDVGAQLGTYSLSFAQRGYRVVAIEPMRQNVLALEASLCLNPELAPHVEVLHTAALGPAHATTAAVHGAPACAVLSPFRASHNVGDGRLECKRGPPAAAAVPPCARRHNGQLIQANFTYFFHYRRFCQQLAPPLRTLDELLQPRPRGGLRAPLERVAVAKVDTGGSECDVLHGGRGALFERMRPALMLVNIDEPRSEACARELAARHGYAVHSFRALAAPPPPPAAGARGAAAGSGALGRRTASGGGAPSVKHVVLARS